MDPTDHDLRCQRKIAGGCVCVCVRACLCVVFELTSTTDFSIFRLTQTNNHVQFILPLSLCLFSHTHTHHCVSTLHTF